VARGPPAVEQRHRDARASAVNGPAGPSGSLQLDPVPGLPSSAGVEEADRPNAEPDRGSVRPARVQIPRVPSDITMTAAAAVTETRLYLCVVVAEHADLEGQPYWIARPTMFGDYGSLKLIARSPAENLTHEHDRNGGQPLAVPR
jgi:hypothetical protein